MKKFWENPVNASVAPEGARVPESIQIGKVKIAPATVLAPMAGVTDTVFRRFIRNASFVRSAYDVMAVPGEEHWEDAGEGAPRFISNSRQGEISGCGLLMTEFTSAVPDLLRRRASDSGAAFRQRSLYAGGVGQDRGRRRL
jgi:tRNA-dihydrouridine synthase B